MTWWQAIILGIVEGLTEYLPVSSTGHLILAKRLLGIGGGEAEHAIDAYLVVIQIGAILAVLGLYFNRVKQMAAGVLGRDPTGALLAINVAVGVLPAVVIGLALEGPIKEFLFGGERWGLWPTVAAWFVGGAAILGVAWVRRARGATPLTGRPITELTWQLALVIGLLQCVAMWPGTSRSLMTILGGVLVGLSLPAAVEFSFLLGVVTLAGAAGKDAVEYRHVMITDLGPVNLLIGIFVAMVSAAIAIKWMVAYLQSHGLAVFGWYRVVLAIGVAAMILSGALQ
ncbi:MAG: undecaprenyl-diphosphate phosphatase [Phycisphaeraceae bacterium]